MTNLASEVIKILHGKTLVTAESCTGGMIGGAAVNLLHPLLGTVGCYVLVIALLLICMVLVTQRSIFIPLGKKGKDAYSKASEHHREQARIRKEERKAQKQLEVEYRISKEKV